MTKAWRKVSFKISMHIRVLHQDFDKKISEIKNKYPGIPTRTISYHANKPISQEFADRRKYNKGRPRKLGASDVRDLKIKLSNLRKVDNPNFTAVKLQKGSGLDSKCSTRTIHRALYSMNYFSLNTRQKGIMTEKDKKFRVKFCKNCLKLVESELWLQRISFYYDGVTFYHKSDPFSEAIQPTAKIWRKRSKGLKLTQKRRKTGRNGRQVKLFVAIAYEK